jgi:hypothetical protein
MHTVDTDRPGTHDWSPVNPTETPTPDAFADRMLAALNGAATVLMVSLGHRTALFDAMHDGVPRTSAALASVAGLAERYVREWFGAMTVSGIVEHDPVRGRYRLPPSHAALLSRHNTDNLAVFAYYIPVLGAVEDDIVRCVRDGGGVPYERYGRFHEVIAEDSAQTVVAALDAHSLPLVPGLIDAMWGWVGRSRCCARRGSVTSRCTGCRTTCRTTPSWRGGKVAGLEPGSRSAG